jgi:hypothetical protein
MRPAPAAGARVIADLEHAAWGSLHAIVAGWYGLPFETRLVCVLVGIASLAASAIVGAGRRA